MKGLGYDFIVNTAKAVKEMLHLKKSVDAAAASYENLKKSASETSSAEYIKKRPWLATASMSDLYEKYDTARSKHPKLVEKLYGKSQTFRGVTGNMSSFIHAQKNGDVATAMNRLFSAYTDPAQRPFFESIMEELSSKNPAFVKDYAKWFDHNRDKKFKDSFDYDKYGASSGGGGGASAASQKAHAASVKKTAHEYSVLGHMGEQAHEKVTESVDHLIHRVKHLLLHYIALREMWHMTKHLFSEMKELETLGRKNQIFMGNASNVYNAIEKFKHKQAEGLTPFSSNDLLEGYNTLAQKGIDATQKFELINNMAAKAGVSFAEASNDIASAMQGNAAAFEKYGLDQKFLAFTKGIEGNTPRMRSAVLSVLENNKALWKDGAKDAVNSIEGYQGMIKASWEIFKEKIIGRPDDPNSLASKIRDTFKKIANFMHHHGKQIAAIGSAIGEVFKRVWSWVEGFGRKIAHALVGHSHSAEEFVNKLKDRTMRFVLFIELVKNKVVWLIKTLWSFAKPFIERAIENPTETLIQGLLFKLAKGFADKNPYVSLACLAAAGFIEIDKFISGARKHETDAAKRGDVADWAKEQTPGKQLLQLAMPWTIPGTFRDGKEALKNARRNKALQGTGADEYGRVTEEASRKAAMANTSIARGETRVDTVNINIHTNSSDPKQHGKLASEALKSGLSNPNHH